MGMVICLFVYACLHDYMCFCWLWANLAPHQRLTPLANRSGGGTNLFKRNGRATAKFGKSLALVLAAIGFLLSAAAESGWDGRSIATNIFVQDSSGQMVQAFQGEGIKAFVFLFVSVDCPICNAYAPEFRKLAADFSSAGIGFRLVYPNREETAEVVRRHKADFEYPFPALRDPDHVLCEAAGVRVTPEAAIFVMGQGWIYRGRIDNRYVELGQERTVTTEYNLRMALRDILDGRKPTASNNRAIGCSISPLP